MNRKQVPYLLAILALLMSLLPLGAAAQEAAPASFSIEESTAFERKISADKTPQVVEVMDASALPLAPAGMALVSETEPNDTAATANALAGSQAVVYGNISPANDVDYFSFTANQGDRVYAAMQTQWSNASGDSRLQIIASDGTTVLEFDDDDGAFGALASSIAGTVIPATGTYYVRAYGYSTTTVITPYHLHVRVQSGAPTAEVEPNNTTATANPLPASGWVSGNMAATTDPDVFSFSLNAGDSVYLALDQDPGRATSNSAWDARLGLGLFGDAANMILVASGSTTTKPNSEAFFMTVQQAGTYYAYIDSTSATGLGANALYNLSVSIYPKATQQNCTTFTSTDVPKAIGPGVGTTTSTIAVPGTVTPAITDINATIVLTHSLMVDLDVNLVGPTGVNVPLFTDVGAASTGGQIVMNVGLDDQAALPIGTFTVVAGMIHQPEQPGRLAAFNGTPAGGTWTLQVADDLASNGGVLQGWSLEICGAPPAPYAVELTKTVGLTPAVCAATDSIAIPPGFDVYYCYTVRNTGLNTLATHDLVDSELGTLFTGMSHSLAPGDTYSYIEQATIYDTVTNTGAWTAYGATGGSASDSDTATVTVRAPVCPTGYHAVTVDAAFFDNPFPPAGWTVTNSSTGCVAPGVPEWTNTNPGGRVNLTGGVGPFAIADSDKCGSGSLMDTIMTTGALDFTGLISATVSYNTDYYDLSATGGAQALVDASLDGGGTWNNLLTWNGSHRGPLLVTQPLTGADGQSGVQVRWHYAQASWDYWWQVDSAFITACAPDAQPPNIDVSPLSLSSTQLPNTTTSQTLNVGNTGGSDLSWAIAEDPATSSVCSAPSDVLWLSTSPVTGTTAPAATTPVQVTFDSTGLAAGTYNASLCIDSDDPDPGPGNGTGLVIVPVTLTVTQPPVPNIDVDPLSLASTQAPNTTTSQTLTVANTGGGTLNWGIVEEPALIRAAATAPENVTGSTLAAVAPTSLTPGVATNLCFTAHIASPDYEYTDRFDVDLPDGWTIGAIAANSSPVANGCSSSIPPVRGVAAGNVVYWQTKGTMPTGCGAWNGGSAGMDFNFCVEVTAPSCTGAPWGIPWNIIGDGWGSAPHSVSGAFSSVTCAAPPPVCSNPADVPWLSLAPTSGATAGGGSTPVTVGLDSTGLAAGDYHASLCIDSDDPDPGPGNGTGLVVVPVTLTVTQPPAPNIDVSPLSLASTQAPNTTTSQTLNVGNTGAANLVWNIAEEPAVVVTAASAPTNARRAPAQVGRSTPRRIASPEAVIFSEGFEGGVVPPTGWTRQVQNTGYTWKIMTVGTPHAGSFSADVEYDPGLAPQSEWLLSPAVTLSSGTLSFWSLGSVYWCRDNYDNCDLEVWLVVGPTAGDGDDIYVGKADPSWPANWTWAQSTFNLTPLLPGGPARVGFRYVGSDGAQVALDDILVDGDTGPVVCTNPADVPWLSEVPAGGTTAPAATTPVTVGFNSTGLAAGTYHANLCVTSNDPDPGPGNGTDLVVVPVTLTVEQAQQVPNIDVSPLSMSSTQAPNTTTSQTLNVGNTGSSDLTWNIVEEPAARPVTAPAGGSVNKLSAPKAVQRSAKELTDLLHSPNADVVQDGSFEAGTPNPFWTEYSLNFGTVLCDTAGCGTGAGTSYPHTGDWWAWFGGIAAYEEGSVTQSVTIPAGGPAALSFWVMNGACSGDPDDYLEVTLDGTQLWQTTGDAPECGTTTYRQVSLDVSAYADGGAHTLAFNSEVFGSDTTNFALDDVVLDAQSGPVVCDNPADVPWLSVSPTGGTTAPAATTPVQVTFDSTGLAAGTYNANLCIHSNDPDPGPGNGTALVVVPVELIVGAQPANFDVRGYAFLDMNGDGIRQLTELTGVAGLPVVLTQGGNPVATAWTMSPSGWYSFSGLPAGSYCAAITIPAPYVATSPTTVCFTLVDKDKDLNFGLRLTQARIGDFVWYDSNGDGVQDAGEPGIPGVTVALRSVVGGAPGAVLATTTTGPDGKYAFGPIEAGAYFVQVTDTGGVLAGLTLTVGPQSKPNPFGPLTVHDGDAYLDADFGYVFACAANRGVISGLVWHDVNGNGAPDAGEAGIPGIQVGAQPLSHLPTQIARTDAQGIYRLCVRPGTYLVNPLTPPAGMAPTQQYNLPVLVRAGERVENINYGYR